VLRTKKSYNQTMENAATAGYRRHLEEMAEREASMTPSEARGMGRFDGGRNRGAGLPKARRTPRRKLGTLPTALVCTWNQARLDNSQRNPAASERYTVQPRHWPSTTAKRPTIFLGTL